MLDAVMKTPLLSSNPLRSIFRLVLLWLLPGLALLPVPTHAAADPLDAILPVRGLCIAAPNPRQVDTFVRFVAEELAPRSVNTLILRVDYGYQYASRPEMANPSGLSLDQVRRLVAVCRTNHIRLIPQINLLGHQSWATTTGALLKIHPEFDETPWIKMPEKYVWPNPDGLYCRSYCPLHPQVHDVVFALVDELCDAFEADAFHAGLDEVFYLGEAKCPRCGGRDKAELFAGEVKAIRDHIQARGRQLWLWGDRLLEGKTTGMGEWEASLNDTHRAVDLIPKDVMICDWHYERADLTAVFFAMKGLNVVTCPWTNPQTGVRQVQDMVRFREQSPRALKARYQGIVQTVWSDAGGFMRDLEGFRANEDFKAGDKNAARCFLRVFDEIQGRRPEPAGDGRKRRVLFIAQSKGYQHEAISAAMNTLYRLGQESGAWDVTLRTDCSALTKKPLQWEAKNLDAYDAVVFYTDGELDMDDAQKADLLSFIRDDGKGFLGIHSAAITFTAWPEYGRLLGGRFDGHPWGVFQAPIVVEAPDFPGLGHLPLRFSAQDEIYQIKDFSRDQVRVLLRLDADKLDLNRDGVHRADRDFAVAWAQPYGKGRVLYNGLGHTAAVWERPELQPMWKEMMLWTLGIRPGAADPRPRP
jgi:type 1 glutamine amidotransferase